VGCYINVSHSKRIVVTCTGEFALGYIARWDSMWEDYFSEWAVIDKKIYDIEVRLQELEIAVNWAVYVRDPNYNLVQAQRTETRLRADLDSFNRQRSTARDFLPLQEWVKDRLRLYVVPLPTPSATRGVAPTAVNKTADGAPVDSPTDTPTIEIPTPSLTATATPTISPTPADAVLPTPPAFGLVAWWPGERDTVDIVGDHSGTEREGGTFDVGLIASAMGFDGTSGYVEIPHAEDLNLSSHSFTIDAWIQPNRSGGGPFRWIIDKSFGNTNLDFSFGLHSDGRLRFITRNLRNDILSPSVIPIGTFTHVAAVQDAASNSIRLYVNGEEVANAVLTDDPVANEAPVVISGRLSDAIHIYRLPLSSGEIQAVFKAWSAGESR
jgi:hypothetical protein